MESAGFAGRRLVAEPGWAALNPRAARPLPLAAAPAPKSRGAPARAAARWAGTWAGRAVVGGRRLRARHPEEPPTRVQQAAERGCAAPTGPRMDKLKKVLSGQDTEDRGGLAEVSASAAG